MSKVSQRGRIDQQLAHQAAHVPYPQGGLRKKGGAHLGGGGPEPTPRLQLRPAVPHELVVEAKDQEKEDGLPCHEGGRVGTSVSSQVGTFWTLVSKS